MTLDCVSSRSATAILLGLGLVRNKRDGVQENLVAEVTSIVQSVVGTAPALNQPLMEAGLDSLGAVELKNALGSRYNISDLPASLIFDYSSVDALAKYLAGNISL